MSRPRSIFPNEATLWDLAYLGCSDREISDALGFHQSLFCKRSDLADIVAKARTERAEAISRHWTCSSQGALRPEDRANCLVELVQRAERRSIQRNRPEQRKNSGDASGEDAQRPALPAGTIGKPKRSPTR
jgi:hypothetical protein